MSPRTITDHDVAAFRDNGFVRIRGVITAEEVADFWAAAQDLVQRQASYRHDEILNQHVNVWRVDDTLRRLTLHARLAAIATRLAGTALRLWHDQLLIKTPGRSAPTEFHQDQPYWPHSGAPSPLTAWIALVDVPVERGCMSFIPRSHRQTDLPRHELNDPHSLFELRPELAWEPRVTVPLRAGDCTFHHGRTAHYAHPNTTDEPRIAHAIIYTDADTVYTGGSHIITDPLNLDPGESLKGELFPLATEFSLPTESQ